MLQSPRAAPFFILAARLHRIHNPTEAPIMLSYILGIIQAFERTHGRLPLLVCLNTQHMQQLLDDCPGLADSNESTRLGFRISILPEESLSHPKVILLPVVRSEKFLYGRPAHFSINPSSTFPPVLPGRTIPAPSMRAMAASQADRWVSN